MQYSSKLKKDTVQVLRSELSENQNDESSNTPTEHSSGDIDSANAENRTKDTVLMKPAQEIGEDVSDSKSDDQITTTTTTPDEQDSDYDPYKCDIDDDDEDEENDETFAPLRQRAQRGVKKKRGRPCKMTSVVGGNTAKKSRLKLVKKAIAKVKGDRVAAKKFEKPRCSKCDYVGLSMEKLDQHMKKAHKDDTVF